MKTKTKLLLALLIGGASLAIFQPATSFATQISTIGGYGPYQTGVGGEFTFYSPDLSGAIAAYYSGAKNQVGNPQPNFQTFCVEGTEFIYPNATYNVVFNDHSVATGDALTVGAAWLYSQFAQGTLGYAFGGGYGNTNSNRYGQTGSAADLLQNAIWHYMGGQEGTGTYDSSNPYELLAATHFLSDGAANSPAGSNNFGVFVMNLTDPATGQNRQDQLIYLPVPDGGATAMLLGVGLLGLFLARRKIATA